MLYHNSAMHDTKVMGFSIEFGVRSISPLPLEGLSLNYGQTFISVEQCAESMTQLC